VDTSLNVYDAKKIAQQTESEMAALIPASSVDRIEQKPTGILMSCSATKTCHWAGETTVYLHDGVDTSQVISSIVKGFSEREGFQSQLETAIDGGPRASIVGPDDSAYIADVWNHGASIEISSFSPCFRLTDDLSPLDKF